eukprot:jgi/Mesvir1/18288/Mv14033-RA.1
MDAAQSGMVDATPFMDQAQAGAGEVQRSLQGDAATDSQSLVQDQGIAPLAALPLESPVWAPEKRRALGEQKRRLPIMKLMPEGAHRWDLELAGQELSLVHEPPGGGFLFKIPCGLFGASLADGPGGEPRAAIHLNHMRKDGIELSSIAGLAVGRKWALDLGIQYDNEVLRSHDATLLRGFASWMTSGDYEIRLVRLQISIYADGADHLTGLYLPDSPDWQHLTMAMFDADMVWYVNDTKLGAVRAQSLIRGQQQAHSERISVIYNVGGSTTSHDGGSKGAWLGSMWGISIVTDVDRTPEQALERKRKADMVGDAAIHDILSTTRWASAFARRQVVMVGNSAKLTQGGELVGSMIDQFDEVIRFNANPTDGFEDAVGSKRTIEVINDLYDFCGCNHGECCSRPKRIQFWRMMAPPGAPQTHVILFNNAIAGEEWFRSGSSDHTLKVTIAPVPEACGPPLNLWAEQHGVLTRFPHWSKCRSGMRMLVLLLLHGVRPTLAGFDTSEKTYAHYTGRQTGVKSDTKNAYYLEQQLISELFRLGLINSL